MNYFNLLEHLTKKIQAQVRFLMLAGAMILCCIPGGVAQTLQCDEQTHTVSATTYFSDFTIPNDPSVVQIRLTAKGGDGGAINLDASSPENPCRVGGGVGATAFGVFNIGSGSGQIPHGSTIRFIVGGRSGSYFDDTANGGVFTGGGGGTGILYRAPGSSNWQILVVAGGGGGAYVEQTLDICAFERPGQGGRASTSGGAGGTGVTGGGAGGSGGHGGASGAPLDGLETAAGGGGAFSRGGGITCINTSGTFIVGEGGAGFPSFPSTSSTVTSENGGDGENCFVVNDGAHGFGGGGAGAGGAGGGGGYSGGGGGGWTSSGGGGGSFVSSIAIDSGKSDGGNTHSSQDGYAQYRCELNEPPQANCMPAFDLQLNAAGNASVSLDDINNESNDPEGGQTTIVLSNSDFSCANLGTNTVTLTITDNTGQSANCTTTVNVVDNSAPIISCPANRTVNSTPSLCSAVVNYTVDMSDNCTLVTQNQTNGLASGAAFPVGVTTNTFVVTDNSGNSNSCSFAVTVTDNEDPGITCPGPISTAVDAGLCTAAVTYSILTTDNCTVDNLNQTTGLASGSGFPLGVTTNRFVVTDASGNTNSCQFTITVTDEQAPGIACPDDISVNIDSGNCSAVVAYTIETTDNCTVANVVQSVGLPSGAAFPVGTTNNTFGVTDNSGNTNNCSFTVTVTDDEAPAIVCPADLSISCDADTSPVANGEATATDNCEVATISFTDEILPGTCADDYTIERSWEAVDIYGNATICVQTITVLPDEIDPLCLNCPADITISCADAIPAVTQLAVTDNCDPAPAWTFTEESTQVTDGSCQEFSYEITRQFTITDRCGNQTAHTRVITIIDEVAPMITCPPTDTVRCDSIDVIAATGFPIVIDNCDPNPTITYEDEIVGGDCEWECQIIRTWTAVDACGNSNSCTQQILSTSIDFIEQALTSTEGLSEPMVLGRSNRKVTIEQGGAACLLSWLPGAEGEADDLPRWPQTVSSEIDCDLGPGLLNEDGKLINPLMYEVIKLGLLLRLDPAMGDLTFEDFGCDPHRIVLQYMRGETIGEFHRVANLFLSGYLGPPFLDKVLEAIQCVNASLNICSPVDVEGLMAASLQNHSNVTERDLIDEDIVVEGQVEVYPNPTSGEVNITLTAYAAKQVYLSMYNLHGQQVWYKEVADNQSIIRFDASQLPSGMYIIRVEAEGQLPQSISVLVQD